MAHPSTPSLGDVTVFYQRRYPLSGARPSFPRAVPVSRSRWPPGSAFRSFSRPSPKSRAVSARSPKGVGRLESRDGPRPSAEGARHCPSGHGGNGAATTLPTVALARGPSRVARYSIDRSLDSIWMALSPSRGGETDASVYLVDPASSHMLVSKIKPCKCQHMPPNG